jgi:glycerophosphoryl diester phosphodiesterase|tara:strand:- start:1001 stop:1627 length:627 start_codon:yes stop_codon:yes gene_type:complete
MKILCHRGLWNKIEQQNTMDAYKMAFESGFGIELDVRDSKSEIIISHDPSSCAQPVLLSDFFDLFKTYKQKIIIVAINIKTDGIALALNRLVNQYNISNYFIFDMSIPEMLKYKNIGLKYFTRLSEYEKDPIMIENAIGIWLDAFETEWYDEDYLNGLLQNKKDICIVSAELHGRDYTNQWALIKGLNDQNNLMLCTDKPNEAREYFR